MRKLASLVPVVAVLALALSPFSVYAADSTVVVHPGDMDGWMFIRENAGLTSTGEMVNGPEEPPLGTGSANLQTPSPTDGMTLTLLNEYQGTRLDEISTLEYSTFRTSEGDAQAIALQFTVDADVTDANDAFQGRLVYEPYYTHDVVTGEWQTWDTMDDAGTGNWWFTNGALAAATGCSIANPCTWSEVVAELPNGGIHNTQPNGVIFKAGSGWAGFDGNVDAFTIGVNGDNTTYDFELEASPLTKADCFDGGWQNYETSHNFKNQGQCVAFVQSSENSAHQ